MYIIKKTNPEKIRMFDAEWEKANVAKIEVVNWPEYSYCPNTTAKML